MKRHNKVLIALLKTGGCAMTGNEADKMASGARYFESPQQAVPLISKLLKTEDFATLAQYYELDGSGIDRQTLASGDFFMRREKPEMAHPGGFWRYKQPFAPGFRYSSMAPGKGGNVYVVTVMVEIEQGDMPGQAGFDTFRMIKSENGWQLLPDQE